jgi:thiamine-phosphate pyrophosphorylase
MVFRLPPIYPITDKKISGRGTHLDIVRELASGGATLIQVRDKETPVRDLLADLRKCVEFAERRGILLLVNDRCDLALSCDASGVHLGQEDLPPEAARRIMGRRSIIGFSTHTLGQASTAQRMPVDYIGFGPVFPTRTKPDASSVAGLRKLHRVCGASSKPVVAIGGIDLSTVREVLEAGASSAAVISALMGAASIAGRMEEFLTRATGKP